MLSRNSHAVHRTLLAAALATGLGLSALQAPAALADESAPQRVVTFTDLDVTSPAGARELYQRLQSASRAVCGPLQGRDTAALRRYNHCRKQALNDAVRAVDAKTLTALHSRSAPRTAQAGDANSAG